MSERPISLTYNQFTRAADYPSAIDLVCALCGTKVSTLEQSEEICRDMDSDAKTCPHCIRSYGEARK